MKVLSQISVGTTETKYTVYGVKRLLVKTGTVAITIYFGWSRHSKDTDGFTVPVSTTYKFTAPEGKKFVQIWVSAASATTIDVTAMDMDVELVA
jgi:hypothetical protein